VIARRQVSYYLGTLIRRRCIAVHLASRTVLAVCDSDGVMLVSSDVRKINHTSTQQTHCLHDEERAVRAATRKSQLVRTMFHWRLSLPRFRVGPSAQVGRNKTRDLSSELSMGWVDPWVELGLGR